ncbi:MAG: 28S ribosomal protein S10, mitochondrial, partial [Marteilia pararefringens]
MFPKYKEISAISCGSERILNICRRFSQVAFEGSRNSALEEKSELIYKNVTYEIQSHNIALLRSYSSFLDLTSKYLAVPIIDSYFAKVHKERFSVLRSVHIYAKHLTQFEIRTHTLFKEFGLLTGSTFDTFAEYTQRNLPPGCILLITKT